MSIAIKVPALSHSLQEARVRHWFWNEGDVVAAREALVELEASGEIITILSPQAGIIEKIFFRNGEMAAVSTTIALLKTGLPNLIWDEEQKALILETYKAGEVTTSMEYELRQMLRLGEGKIGKGFESGMALPQSNSTTNEYGAGMGEGMAAQNIYKPQPILAASSQFSGDIKNPNVMIPENAQKAPQYAPTLGAAPNLGPTAPTPKPHR